MSTVTLWYALKSSPKRELGVEERRVLIDAMITLSDPTSDHGATFSFAEVREVLREIDDRGRGQAIWSLSNILERKKNWEGFVAPFIESAWPQQIRFQSEEATRGFLRMAEAAGDSFPDVVETILPLVRPIPHADMFTYSLSKDGENEQSVTRQFPEHALKLLNAITADDRVRIPYGLSEALTTLGELAPDLRQTDEYRRLNRLLD